MPTTDTSFIATTGAVYAIATDDSYIYWVLGSGSGSIGRANLDGSGVNNTFITGLSYPRGIAVDGAYIYWGASHDGKIGRANLDGSGVNSNFITGLTVYLSSSVSAVVVDASHIYWANTGSGKLGRANLDGSSANQSLATIGSAGDLYDLATDGSYLYVVDGAFIKRTALDGSGLTSLGAPGPSPNILGLRVDNSRLYYFSVVSTTNKIGRAHLDGSSAADWFSDSHASYSQPGFGAKLTAGAAECLYWGCYPGSYTIARATNLLTTATFSLTQGQSAAVKAAAAEVVALTQGAAIAQPKTVTRARAVTQAALTAQEKTAARARALTQGQFLMLPLPGVFTTQQAAAVLRNRGLPETLALTQAASVLRGLGRSRSARPPTQNQAVGGGDRDYVGGAMSFTRIQIRRDTAANWTSANPVLADGEPGYEHDTRREKVGDGTTAWADLPYVGDLFVKNGSATLASGAVSVTDARITADSIVKVWNVGASGTVGALSVTLTAGVGFAINSTSGTDDSTVYYEIVNY